MPKKLMLLLIVGLLLFSQGTYAIADTDTAKSLSLQQGIELALKNNLDVRRAALSYEQAVLAAKDARMNASDLDEDALENLSAAQAKYVTTEQTKLAETAAEQAQKIAIEKAKNNVESSYYSVLKAQSLVEVNKTAVTRAQTELALVQKKFKAGTAVKTDVNRSEINLASSKADLVNAQMDLKNAQVALNKLIGLDVNTELKLSPILNYEQVTLPTVADLTKEVLANRLEIQKAQNSVKIAELNYDLTVKWLAPNVNSAKNRKIQVESAKLDLIQAEQDAQADVISTLFQIQKSDEVVLIKKKNLDQAKENYTLAQRRYQIGVGTYSDVQDASVDFVQADANYIQAVYDYNIAKNKLKTIVLVSA